MKKIFLLLTLVFVTACNNKNEHSDKNLHITGSIDGLKQGTIYVKHIKDTLVETLDSISIKGNSTFESHINIAEPEMLYLFLDRGNTQSLDNSVEFFAEPGNITLKTTLKEFYAKMKVEGSENHTLYEEFKNYKSRFNDENLKLIEARLKNQEKNNLKTADSIENEYAKLLKRKYLYTANFAVNHSDKEIAPFIALSEISNAHIILLDTIQKSMTDKIKKSLYGKKLTTFVNERKKLENQ